jgi:hypothetical protein
LFPLNGNAGQPAKAGNSFVYQGEKRIACIKKTIFVVLFHKVAVMSIACANSCPFEAVSGCFVLRLNGN